LKEDKTEGFAVERLSAATETTGVLRCPQCRSPHIRRRSLPLLLNAGVCCVLGVLTCAGIPLASGLFWGLLVALHMLPVTAYLAVAGWYRCLACGERFRPAHEGQTKETGPGFPWRFYALSVVLLLLLCVAGPPVIRIANGGSRKADLLTVAGTALRLSLALWAGVFWQVLLYHLLRKKLRSAVAWAILFVLPALLAGGWLIHRALPAVRAGMVLPDVRMAPLPKSATDLKFYDFWCPDEATVCMRFRADPADIERFLAASAALQGAEWKMPASEQMVSPWGPSEPTWYKEGIRKASRSCSVRSKKKHSTITVSVAVDDAVNLVYVSIVWLD